MIQDDVKANGNLTITLKGPDGQIKQQIEVSNLIVTTGKNWMAERMTGAPTAMSHMAVGSVATAPDDEDTTLAGELARAALVSQVTVGNVSTYSATFAAGVGTGALVEAGILNAVAVGTLLNRAIFPVVNKGADDIMSIVWAVTQN